MGRKSALTDDQWAEIERRMLLGGESAYKLAEEFSVNESSIRRRIKPNKADKAEFGEKSVPELRAIANRKAAADVEASAVQSVIGSLPYVQQQIVMTLAQRLSNITGHLAGAAEFGASTAHRLSGIANAKVSEVDDSKPLDDDSRKALTDIAALQKMANEASLIGMSLIKANQEAVDEMTRREGSTDKPKGIAVRLVAPKVAA